MKEQLAQIKQRAMDELNACKTVKELEDLRVKVLGKKGELTGILKQMGKLSAEERPVIGQLANEVRQDLEEKMEAFKASLKEKQIAAQLASEQLDVTMPDAHLNSDPCIRFRWCSKKLKRFFSEWDLISQRARRLSTTIITSRR